jgi:hypothetical protein
MTAIADMTVKKNDGTTDVTYTAIVASSGDSPSVYRNEAIGTAPVHRPELRHSSKRSGEITRQRITYQYPQLVTDSTTGLVSVHKKAFIEFVLVTDSGMSQTDVNEAISQFANMLDEPHIKLCLKSGYAAT